MGLQHKKKKKHKSEDLNSGPRAWVANAILTELLPQHEVITFLQTVVPSILSNSITM